MFLFSEVFKTKQIPTILKVLENLLALLCVVFHPCLYLSCTELLKMAVYIYCLRDVTEENHPFPNFHQDRLIFGAALYMTRDQL